MARPKKNVNLAQAIEQAESQVLKTKAAYEKAVDELKRLRDLEQKERQEALLKAVANSKWSYEKIMDFLGSDPADCED